MERLSQPTTKWWISTGTIVLTIVAVVIAELQAEGVELPYIVGLVGLLANRIATYLKTETRPSPSAREAVFRQQATIERASGE